jgi:protein-tyrosine phosphatase
MSSTTEPEAERTSTIDSEHKCCDGTELKASIALVDASEGSTQTCMALVVCQQPTAISKYARFSSNPLIEAGIHKIADRLYLGNGDGAKNRADLDLLQVKAIVNVTCRGGGYVANHFESKTDSSIVYLRVPWIDDPEQDVRPGLELAYKFMVAHMDEQKHAVFVHCAAGVSRSATVVVYYLMRSQRIPLLDAFRLARRGRRCVEPNAGFLKQLVQLEAALFDNKTSIASDVTKWPELRSVWDYDYDSDDDKPPTHS